MARIKYYNEITQQWEYADSAFSSGQANTNGGNGDETIPDGSITTEKIADEAVTPEKTSFFERKTSSEDNILMFDGVYAKSVDSTLFNIGATYGTKAIAVDLKANTPYMFTYLHKGTALVKGFGNFNGNKPSTDYPNTRMWEADIDENNELTGTYTEITPTIVSYPSSTISVWWDGGYDIYGNKTYTSYPITIDGTEYWIGYFKFVVDKDFRGLIGHSAQLDAEGTYTRIYEYSDEYEYNPVFDGLPKPIGEGFGQSLNIFKEFLENPVLEILEENPTHVNLLRNKKWIAMGDSLTQYSGGECEVANTDDKGFITQIMRKTGIIGVNKGYAGRKWSSGTDGEFEVGSAVYQVNEIINGSEMYDIVTFAYGTNSDVDGEGTVDDAPSYDSTMCSAIKWCIEKLVEWNPQVQIGIILPPQRADLGSAGNLSMKTRGDLIKEVASLYGVPCCDMWSESGINTMYYVNPATGNNKYYYLSDMLHLNDFGAEKYASCLKPFLERIVSVYPNNGVFFDYAITNNLANVTNSNKADKAPSGVGYSATLTASSGTITNVTVTMGGSDITSTAYVDGTITIDAINGDIVITATAE